jgi:hypothetical protein
MLLSLRDINSLGVLHAMMDSLFKFYINPILLYPFWLGSPSNITYIPFSFANLEITYNSAVLKWVASSIISCLGALLILLTFTESLSFTVVSPTMSLVLV